MSLRVPLVRPRRRGPTAWRRAGPEVGSQHWVMTPLTVRPAQPADVDAVLEMWRASAENESRPLDTRSAVVALLEQDPLAMLVAEDDGELIGSISAGWDGWRGHLYRLAVRPDHRRRGVGRALLDAAEERLAALGAQRFDAMVLDGNQLGHRLWEAAGYRGQDEWGRWVKSAQAPSAPR